MRLRRLDLIRYGKFTDAAIDFGPKPDSGIDLHIVFGLNEAGKSTALSAYLDLLFGIEERSRYSFLHDYSAMRIGGVLELNGSEHIFNRTKQRSNSLLNASGRPISEVAISANLAGLTRDAYKTMFSLDDETLEAGGKSILESRGDLGKLLFTASAGLEHASDTLNALEAEADGLYRKQAQGTEVALLRKRLADLKSRREAIDTLAATYEALESDHRDAAQHYDLTIKERAALAARLEAIARYNRARPILLDIRRKVARLDELPVIDSPARNWTGSVAELIEDDASLRTRLSANIDEVDRLNARIASVEVDEAILALSERIHALAEAKVRYASAGLDLPNRRMDLQILDSAVANYLAALGRTTEPNPRSLLLPAATVGVLRTMVEQRSGVAAAARAARDEAAAALEALQKAKQRVGEERAVPAPARARLSAALSKARESTYRAELRSSEETEDAATVRWRASLERLWPWSGGAVALAAAPIPTAGQISAWRTAVSELAQRTAVIAQRLAEFEGNRALLAARLDALRASVDIADDEEAAAIRRCRDEAWTRHRETLTGDTADEFALLLARDDTVAAGRLAKASDLADVRATARALAETTPDLARIRQQRAQANQDAEAQLREIRSASKASIGDGADLSLERLIERVEEWNSARIDALAAWEQIELARRKAERATDEKERLRQQLSAALASVGIASAPSDDLEAIVVIAEIFLDRQRKLDAEYAEAVRMVETREDDLANRRLAFASAERLEEEWLAGVADALQGTWLAGGLSASAVGSVLDQLAELSKSLQERDALRLRVDKMEADRANFLTLVSAVATDARELAADDPEQVAMRLAERLKREERMREAMDTLETDLKRLQELRADLDSEISAHELRKSEMLAAYGVGTLLEVMERDDLLRERDGLRAAVAESEERIAGELEVESFEQARLIVDELDFDALEIEKAEAGQRLNQLDDAIQHQLIRRTRAEDKLEAIGGDSAVARLDAQRRTTLLEIEQKAERYIELKLGIMSAGNAIRVYRERHRSGMMERASNAFSLMTRGQYSGLTTQPVKSGEVLIALQRDGQSKVADALSKGARFQLYLALRLAGYYEFAHFRPSVPFIADDIMETFDHERSEEVFRLFGEMAKAGQVIYLTHHKHLCDIAKTVVPNAMIHELG